MIIIEVKKIDILSLLKANRFIIDEKLVNDIIFKMRKKSRIVLSVKTFCKIILFVILTFPQFRFRVRKPKIILEKKSD